MTRRRALLAFVVGALAGMFVAPDLAAADAAGPTDYVSEIVAIDPATDAVEISIVGGDAFVEITVAPGHEVEVLGYLPDQEPYLRIRADGVVERNRRSYATYYNEDRYGGDDIPDIVDTTAAPAWERVGDGGTYAWHDHRAHWMDEDPPVGLEPGDSLPPMDIPLTVDGVATRATVVTTLQPSASPIMTIAGALIGAALGLAATVVGRAVATLVALLLSVSALAAGVAQYTSLPATTGPQLTWWVLPAAATACSLGVIAIYRRSIWVETGLLSIAALQLIVWAWPRRDHATSAYLPTDLPADADRLVSMMVLVGAVFVLVAAGRALVDEVTVRTAE